MVTLSSKMLVGKEVNLGKYKFIIVGSGWRSLYYVRIAKSLPEEFELCAMYCRSQEKADLMSEKYGIHTTTSIEECIDYNPDFVVVVVNKGSIADVSIEWMNRGFTVLCETPASLDMEMLNRLWSLHKEGKKLVVAEQYTRYPEFSTLLKVLDRGMLGDRSCLNISLAHEYHGASLMRALLDVDIATTFKVKAKTYEFPTTETLTRYDSFKDGRIANKKRTVATFEFSDGKVALYDFDSEQYRSPIRKNTVKLQGVRGELIDNKIYYLDADNNGKASCIEIKTREVETESDNPNLHIINEVTEIVCDKEVVYGPVFGLCGLAQDETAIATLMRDTALYSRGEMGEPYPLKDALQDAYMAILLTQAAANGEEIISENQIWTNE